MRILPPYLCLILMAFALVSHGHAATCKSYSSCAQAVKSLEFDKQIVSSASGDTSMPIQVCKFLPTLRVVGQKIRRSSS